ncbi:MAG TPA: glycosyltransferase family A protein [Dongiaceae bacterium]|nr:glycosyltransferase family A protein [Dongiaceae bacterium]
MTRSTPEVSIVLPAFNANPFLAAALDTIKAQTFGDYEIIVVDDGSDQSPEPIVRAVLPEATYIVQPRRGPSAARNAALAVARGDFIAFLDADDLWLPATLEKLRKGFRDAPGADIVQGHIKRFGSALPASSANRAYLSFNVGSLLVRRHAFDRAGLFDESLHKSEDVDLHIRFKEAGLRRFAIPDIVLLYRRHPAASNEIEPPRVLRQTHHGSWMRLLSASLARRRAAASAAEPRAKDAAESRHVTAVLVVKDGRRYLPSALASIRGQTRAVQSIVAVVADGGDGSLEYLASQPDVAAMRQTGSGLAQARNQAIGAIDAGLVAFLDCDDLWHPDKIALQVEALAMFAMPGFCITNFRRVRDAGDALQTIAIDAREYRMGTTPSAMLADKAVFDATGGFDPALGNGCDTDWFARALASDVPAAVLGQVLMHKRIHAANLSRDPARNRRDMLRVIAKRRRPSGQA